jgi:hypothetical protein
LEENKIKPNKTQEDVFKNMYNETNEYIDQINPVSDMKINKYKLASKILGVSSVAIKEVFNKTSSTLPVIYWFTIGTVKHLRNEFNISDEYDDDDVVAKIGETDNLKKCMDECINTCDKILNTSLYLKSYNYIDPQYISKAGSNLLSILDKMGYKLYHPKHKEFIIYPNTKKEIKIIEEQFESVSKKYIGHIKDISEKLKNLENELKTTTLQNELKITKLQHSNELLQKELTILQKETEKELIMQQKETEKKLLEKDLIVANKKIKRMEKN